MFIPYVLKSSADFSRTFLICPLRVPGPLCQALPLSLNSFHLHGKEKCLVMANVSEKLETLTQQIHN